MAKKQILIDQTQRLIADNKTLGLVHRILEIHSKKVWREVKRANGKDFQSFSEFCTTKQPYGLGAGQYNGWLSVEALHGMMKGHSEVQSDLMEARVKMIQPVAKHGGPRTKQVDNINLVKGGTSSTYLLAKMKRMANDGDESAADALHRLAIGGPNGLKSVRKAAIACGVVKPADSDAGRSPVQRMKQYWKKASAAERREFLSWTETAEAKKRKRR